MAIAVPGHERVKHYRAVPYGKKSSAEHQENKSIDGLRYIKADGLRYIKAVQ